MPVNNKRIQSGLFSSRDLYCWLFFFFVNSELCSCVLLYSYECSYPLSERSGENAKYMRTRPPSWCDRVFMNAAGARLVGLLSDGRPKRRISRPAPPVVLNHTPDRLAPPSPVRSLKHCTYKLRVQCYSRVPSVFAFLHCVCARVAEEALAGQRAARTAALRLAGASAADGRRAVCEREPLVLSGGRARVYGRPQAGRTAR